MEKVIEFRAVLLEIWASAYLSKTDKSRCWRSVMLRLLSDTAITSEHPCHNFDTLTC